MTREREREEREREERGERERESLITLGRNALFRNRAVLALHGLQGNDGSFIK